MGFVERHTLPIPPAKNPELSRTEAASEGSNLGAKPEEPARDW